MVRWVTGFGKISMKGNDQSNGGQNRQVNIEKVVLSPYRSVMRMLAVAGSPTGSILVPAGGVPNIGLLLFKYFRNKCRYMLVVE